ncbi:MAG: hypothetical protein GF346_02405 [Candidatus Eisenbacteria bacterium]|nr:hypothetical protein [Candidatus Latescibacterota bacterium]MBD3301280.1 hypothetical protein [Candidatus Eisenbacteria bacterium]
MTRTVTVNRAPVLTLWGSVVAERLGHDTEAALTLGKALAGLNAQAKGRRLGIFKERKAEDGKEAKRRGLGEEFWVEICGRPIPAKQTEEGVRAVVRDEAIDPQKVLAYLHRAFGEELIEVRASMGELAKALDPDELRERAYALYEEFRPQIARGRSGWGQKGTLDLEAIRRMARASD